MLTMMCLVTRPLFLTEEKDGTPDSGDAMPAVIRHGWVEIMCYRLSD